MPKGLLLAVLTLLAPVAASAQRNDAEWLDDCRSNRWNNDRDDYCEVRTADFRLGGRRLTVDAGSNGGISIHGWDRDNVEVHERIAAQAYTSAEAETIAKQVRIQIADGRISAEGPSQYRGRSWYVTYDIFVPRSADLQLEASNGPISIAGTSGKIDAVSVNGPLNLTGLSGDVHARTSNGPLRVALTGNHWVGGSLDAETTNGPVDLSIPDGYSARLVTGTVNGPMRSDFPITLQGNISPRRISTDIGSGGATVRAMTTNGPLVIRRN